MITTLLAAASTTIYVVVADGIATSLMAYSLAKGAGKAVLHYKKGKA